MTPTEYEHLVASVLSAEGWHTVVSPPTGDHGVDVLATREGERIAVQAKMFGTNRVINGELVMLAYGAAHYADCERVMIATDGRANDDAHRVAAKLGVELRHIPAVGMRASSAVRAAPAPSIVEDEDFGRFWAEHVAQLAGQVLRGSGDRTNTIISVHGGGVLRRTSNGREQLIPIEIFRWTYRQLHAGRTVTREEINDNHTGRASSGVMLILCSTSVIEATTVGGKQALRLRPGL